MGSDSVRKLCESCINITYGVPMLSKHIVFSCSLLKITEKGMYKVQVRMSP